MPPTKKTEAVEPAVADETPVTASSDILDTLRGPYYHTAPSFIDELYTFSSRLADVPYHELGRAFFEAGWLTHLTETGTTPCYDGTVLVHFDLLVGKSLDRLERLESLSVRIAPGPGPVSIAARLSARESVIFLLSNRLPPPPQAPQQAAPVATPPERAVERDDVPLPGERPLPPEPAAEEEPGVRVVERREVDGMPIFRDLYDIGSDEANNTGEIINAVLDAVQEFLAEAGSVEAVNALATKNPDLLTFIKDVGDEQDVNDLLAMVNKRRNELERPANAPRRRTPSVPRAN